MLNGLRTAVVGKGGAIRIEKRLVPLTEYLHGQTFIIALRLC